jgi:N-dimethylarginine dimethylaminohydrolase
VEVLELPADDRTGLDSLYAHDPVLITDRGAVIFQTGKIARRGEGPAFADALRAWDVPILGTIDGPATAEAGDMVWLDRDTLLVGRGFRTNALGIERLADLLRPLGVTVIPVELPYWNGPQDVLHLMSFISLLDDDLAVVYRRILPVPLFELLAVEGVQLVDVPDQEYDSMGCNVLAVSPRNVVMVAGNPVTRSRLETAGCKVTEFDGSEICIPGAGGPTCLTRPLLRSDA